MRSLSVVEDVDHLNWDALDKMAGTRKGSIARWAKEDENFLSWLLDKDTTKRKLQATAQMAADRLGELMGMELGDGRVPGTISAKDLTKVVELAATLGDLFPATKRETIYKDANLEKIMEKTSQAELEEEMMKRAQKIKGRQEVLPDGNGDENN